jgi:uncharacterized pyridoxamine 5'-phosphate oxidase family protein
MIIRMDTPIDEAYVLNYLHKNMLGVLSTVSSDGMPHAAPIYFVTSYTFEIFFITPRGTQKSMNIDHKNDVLLTVIDESKTETVQIRGSAVEAPGLLDSTLRQLAEKLHYGATFLDELPVLKYKDQEKIVMKVIPSEVRMRRYTEYAFVEKIVKPHK